MFCPKCAAQNVDGASFCRACGANISLVPQALSGKLPAAPVEACDEFGFRRRRRGEPSIDNAVRALMMGIAFAVIFLLVGRFSPGGSKWWFWLLIPAVIFLSRGVSSLVRMKQTKDQPATFASPQINSVRAPELPVPRTGELLTPVPSVTEGTTRHLGAEAQTRHLDSQ
jgi:zinc-ribbon domain